MNFQKSFFNCKLCKEYFSRRDTWLRHQKSHIHRLKSSSITKKVKKQKKTNIFCNVCQENVLTHKYVGHLRSLQHKSKCINPLNEDVIKIKSCFSNRMASYRIMNKGNIDLMQFLTETGGRILNLFALHELPLKYNIELFCKYIKMDVSIEIIDIKSFNTKFITFMEGDEFNVKYNNLCEIIKSKSEEFQVCFLFYNLTKS